MALYRYMLSVKVGRGFVQGGAGSVNVGRGFA